MNARRTAVFVYRNWKGHVRDVRMLPESIEYREKPFHSGPQWFIHGFDLDRQAQRTYAVVDILTPIRFGEVIDNPCNVKGKDE